MADQVHDLTPEDVAKGMAEGRYLLVDVREPNEVAVEAYPDAVVVPLSSFDPQDIPDPDGKQVVFACRSGKRSVTASLAAQRVRTQLRRTRARSDRGGADANRVLGAAHDGDAARGDAAGNRRDRARQRRVLLR